MRIRLPDELRDGWIAGGVALLAVLTALAMALYASAPQSVAEAAAAAGTAARPSSYDARLGRARERLNTAGALASAGHDTAAATAFAQAADEADRARLLAGGDSARAAAADVWARAMLGGAEIIRKAGTGTGIHADDNALLRRALAMVDQVLAAPVAPATRARAAQMRDSIRRALRPGPLEWLPS